MAQQDKQLLDYAGEERARALDVPWIGPAVFCGTVSAIAGVPFLVWTIALWASYATSWENNPLMAIPLYVAPVVCLFTAPAGALMSVMCLRECTSRGAGCSWARKVALLSLLACVVAIIAVIAAVIALIPGAADALPSIR